MHYAMRILHVIDVGSPGGGACTLRLAAEAVARLTSSHHRVIIIGNRAHADLAKRCGIRSPALISPPVGNPLLGRSALKKLLRGFQPFDLILAWSAGAAMAVRSIYTGPMMAFLAVGPISGASTAAFMRILHRRPMPLLCASSAVRREYCSMGVDESLLSVLVPGITLDESPAEAFSPHRDQLRARWKLDNDTLAVGLLSEPLTWADVRIASAAAAAVAAAGRRLTMIAHPDGANFERARQWCESLGMPGLVTAEPLVAEPWHVVRGLDAALLIGGESNVLDLSLDQAGSPIGFLIGGARRLRPLPGITPLLIAMTAGLPLVAEASDAVADIIEDGVTGLLVNQHDVVGVADRLMRLADDRQIAGRIGNAARAAARSQFGISPFCVRLKHLCERLIAPAAV